MVPMPWDPGLYPLLRDLVYTDADFAKSVRDDVALSNTGYFIDFPDLSPEEGKKTVAIVENEMLSRWMTGAYSGSSLADQFFYMLYMQGVLGYEIVLAPGLSDIQGVAPLQPEWFRFKLKQRNEGPGYHLIELLQGPYAKRTNDPWITMPESTVRYCYLQRDIVTPYGVPPLMAALRAYDLKNLALEHLGYALKTVGLLGIYEFATRALRQEEGETQEQWYSRTNAQRNNLAQTLLPGIKDQGMIVTMMDVDDNGQNVPLDSFKNHPIANEHRAVTAMMDIIMRETVSGLGAQGFMFGLNMTTTESQADVLFEVQSRKHHSARVIVAKELEYIIQISMLLRGMKGTPCVKFNPSYVREPQKQGIFVNQQSQAVANYMGQNFDSSDALRMAGVPNGPTFSVIPPKPDPASKPTP